MTELTVVIVSDFLCPWCFVGFSGLKSLATTWADKFNVRIEMGTYYLDTGITRNTGRSLAEHFKAKGKSDEEIEALMKPPPKGRRKPSPLEMLAADADIYFPPGRNQQGWRMYHSGKAHLLEKYATATVEDHSKVETLILNIYKAFHLENRNIDNDEVLLEIVQKSGLKELTGVREAINNEEELQKSYAEAAKNQEREVGVPQYYFYKEGQLVHTLSGAQEIKTLYKALKTAAEA